MTIFDSAHADQYDLFHREKDYRSECDLIEETFRRFKSERVRTIADFGCGTGSHAIPLAERGYSVTGIDRSRSMLEVAKQKAVKGGFTVRWVEGDVREIWLNELFDAALLMFAVLGYMARNEDVAAALRNIRAHLRPGGLLAFDVWYGPAVLAIKPSNRVREFPTQSGKIVRRSVSTLDTRHHECRVDYHLQTFESGKLVSESEESHVVRYYFPLELEAHLAHAGFALASLTEFPSMDKPVGDAAWNAYVVARAV